MLLLNFFPIVDVPQLRRYSPSNCAMVPRWRFLETFLRPVFSASLVQQVSDLHLKFALKPHYVWKYGRHPVCGSSYQARKKRKKKKNKRQDENIMVCPIPQGDHKQHSILYHAVSLQQLSLLLKGNFSLTLTIYHTQVRFCFSAVCDFLWPLYGIGQAIIFLPCSFFPSSSSSFFSSPILSRRRLDVCHTSAHGVVLVRI